MSTAASTVPSSGSRSAALRFPAVAVGIVYLYFFAGQYGGVNLAPLRLSSVLISAAVLLAFIVAGWRHERWRLRTRLWPAIAAVLAALVVTTVTSRNQRISLDFLGYAVLLAGLYLLLVALLRDDGMRRRIGVLMVGLTIAVCGWYLWDVISAWAAWWQMVGRVTLPSLRPEFDGLTFGNPGGVAAMAVLTGLSAAGHLTGSGRRGSVAAGVLAVVVVLVVLISGTRGAWVASGATAVVGAVLAAGLGGARAPLRAALARWQGRAAAGAGLLAALAGLAVLGPGIVSRVLNSGDGGRISYWLAAIRMFLAAPLTGVGPGMWAPERIRFTVAPEIDYYIGHAHNVYLNTAAELGLVGLAAGVAVVVVAGRLVIEALRGREAVRRRWAIVAVLGATYFGVHQLFDVFVGVPGALFVFAVPFAFLDATALDTGVEGEPAVAPRRGLLAGTLSLAVVLTVAWTGWNERPALQFADGEAAAAAGDWTTAAADSKAAAQADPSMAPYRLMTGLGALHEGQSGTADLEAAAALDDMPNAWLNLAFVDVEAGDRAGATTALNAAMRLGDQQPALLVPAGVVAERLGETNQADRWFASALGAIPRIAAATSFWEDPARSSRWPSIAAAAAGSMAPEAQVDFWLSAGDIARARSAAATIADAAARNVSQLAIGAWEGDGKSWDELEALASQQPRDVTIVGWCARLAARQGEMVRALDYRIWLETIEPYSSTLGLEVKITDQLAPGGGIAGANWGIYGIYTYRRPTAADLLAPGLPHLVWSIGS